MKKQPFILFLYLFIHQGCSFNKKDITSNSKQHDDVNNGTTQIIYLDTLTENRHAYIKRTFRQLGETYIEVDYVNYLMGNEAALAEIKDQAYFIDKGDTISNITDGYFISNKNSKIRTFRLAKNAVLEYLLVENRKTLRRDQTSLNIKEIQIMIDKNTLMYLHIENGIIKSMDEQFLP